MERGNPRIEADIKKKEKKDEIILITKLKLKVQR